MAEKPKTGSETSRGDNEIQESNLSRMKKEERNHKYEEYLRELQASSEDAVEETAQGDSGENNLEYRTITFFSPKKETAGEKPADSSAEKEQKPVPAEPGAGGPPDKIDTGSSLPAKSGKNGGSGKNDGTGKKKKKKKKHSRGKKAALIIVAIVLVLVLVAGYFVMHKLNMLKTGGDKYSGTGTMENDIDAADIDSITDASSLRSLLKEWATNGGDKMKSKYVTNILLLGVDSKSKLSDSMLILSVNVRTKKISLVSFYRDSYTYLKNSSGDEFYAKLNSAYLNGGAKLVQKTIQDDYKIQIDDYAVVDYDTFPKLIDALGGVKVKVTKAEAEYLNETWYKWTRTGNQITFKAGTMTMDGEHALMFCRIRKLDSDVGRTDRQRRVLVSIMDSMSGASLSKLNKVINVLLPNVKTNMSKTEVLSMAKNAISDGWSKYPVSQATMPPDDCCLPGYAGDQWIWICDYEGAAAKLQKMLYGQTNIKLSKNRVSALDFAQGDTSATTYSSGSSYYGYSTTSPTYYTTASSGSSGGSGSSSGGSSSGSTKKTTAATTSKRKTTESIEDPLW